MSDQYTYVRFRWDTGLNIDKFKPKTLSKI